MDQLLRLNIKRLFLITTAIFVSTNVAFAHDACEDKKEEPKLPRWENHYELGFSGSLGNSETFDFHTALTLMRIARASRYKYDAAYFYASSSDTTTQNQATTGLRAEYLFPDTPWSLFAQARYDWDEFGSWEQRVAVHVGAGYQVIDWKTLDVILRAGGGAIKEYESENEDIRPEGLAGGELTWLITKGQKFYADTYIYPDLDDIGEYRVVSTAEWSIKVRQMDRVDLAVKLGAKNEYQSKVGEDFENNDFKYYGALAVDF